MLLVIFFCLLFGGEMPTVSNWGIVFAFIFFPHHPCIYLSSMASSNCCWSEAKSPTLSPGLWGSTRVQHSFWYYLTSPWSFWEFIFRHGVVVFSGCWWYPVIYLCPRQTNDVSWFQEDMGFRYGTTSISSVLTCQASQVNKTENELDELFLLYCKATLTQSCKFESTNFPLYF